jgi:dephospho-CoA kinase
MIVDKLIVGLSGMPGSGKSIVVTVAQDLGFSVVIMGDIVREETKRRKLVVNPKNIGEVMLELRKSGGKSIVAKKCIPKIKELANQKIIIDGMRSLHELDLFKKYFSEFYIISVHSSPKTRYKRLNQRGRSDDSRDLIVFEERDRRELNVGLGKVIAMSDYMIINEGNIEDIKRKSYEILQRIEKKWMK